MNDAGTADHSTCLAEGLQSVGLAIEVIEGTEQEHGVDGVVSEVEVRASPTAESTRTP
jgi:hypothetical protein